jgi:heptaprenyl diphosphate synthase
MTRAWIQTLVLGALAVALNMGERSVIGALPFVRLGIANSVTLVVLVAYGPRHALALTVGRVVVASLLTGVFMGPTFAIGLGGALGAWAAMTGAWSAGRWLLGPLGVSVIGACAHNVSQVAVASLVLLGTWELTHLWPLVALVSAGAGSVTGLVALGMGRALFPEGAAVRRLAVDDLGASDAQAADAVSRSGGRQIENRESTIGDGVLGGGPVA